jgi:hypothetical protein
MLVVEAKLKNGTPEQYHQLDEAIKTSQFVRNSCVRYWLDNQGTTRNDLQKLCAVPSQRSLTVGVCQTILTQNLEEPNFYQFNRQNNPHNYPLGM